MWCGVHAYNPRRDLRHSVQRFCCKRYRVVEQLECTQLRVVGWRFFSVLEFSVQTNDDEPFRVSVIISSWLWCMCQRFATTSVDYMRLFCFETERCSVVQVGLGFSLPASCSQGQDFQACTTMLGLDYTFLRQGDRFYKSRNQGRQNENQRSFSELT